MGCTRESTLDQPKKCEPKKNKTCGSENSRNDKNSSQISVACHN